MTQVPQQRQPDPDEPQAGENLCPDCSGSGQADDRECPTCQGSGKVIEPIGGA